jgi:proteasome assembly chaperone (PAC2) family protein
MNESVKITARPKLNSPSLLAAWPGIGHVSMLVANYLEKKLDFKKLGEIKAARFFDPIGVAVQNNLVEAPQFPRSAFSYWKNPEGGNDIILFTGEDQPAANAYELANCVLDVGLKFGVKRIYTCAAAVTRIHHTEQSRVWGVATVPELMDDLKKYDLVRNGNLQISGLNGLLLGVAKERSVEGICLLGEVPGYTTRIQNPMAALAILGVLPDMLGIKIDILEMSQVASETRHKMKQLAAEAMEEYIDLFTEPIWEQNEGEDDDEEDDYYESDN